MRTIIVAIASIVASGCTGVAAPNGGGDLPIEVLTISVVRETSSIVILTTRLSNRSDVPIILSVRCTPLQVDQHVGGSWLRNEDLRLCTPPNQMVVPPRATLDVSDGRGLDAGEFRVVVESPDGRSAYSAPFVIVNR